MPAFRVSAKHAAKVAQSRAATHTPQENISRMARVHQGAGIITRKSPIKLTILSLMTVLALACITVFDVSPAWIEFKKHVGKRVNQYTSLVKDCDHRDEAVATPRRLSNALSNATGSCKMDDVAWAAQVGVEDAQGAGLINAKNSEGDEQQYAACVDLEDYMDKGRAGQYWMSGDSTHKGLTTLDCLATKYQFRSETSYQIDLCVRSESGGEWYKDVEVKTMELISSPAERLECNWWRCDELGETKGQGKHCLHCKCGNPPNVTCEPRGDWCKKTCVGDEKYLFRMSKAACPEICLQAKKMWVLPSFFFGMIYMFIALAIVVDEFFVPALELFCEKCEISDDIAGATFMAAGGSMPELFTSFIGTFRESTVGFATIVGSAVFNVLFVIGVCAFAASEPLKLTWWPLARDCSFYMVALFLVVLVFGIITPYEIDLWEALVLLGFYISYCSFMKFNAAVEQWVKSKLCKESKVVPEETEADGDKEVFQTLDGFKAGILKFLISKAGDHLYKQIGLVLVTKVRGNGEDTFGKIKSLTTGSNSVGHTVDKEHVSEDDWINMFKMSGSFDGLDEQMAKNCMKVILRNAKCPLKGTDGQMEMTEDAFKLFYRDSVLGVQRLATPLFSEIETNTGNDDDAHFDASDAIAFFKKHDIEISKEDVNRGIQAIVNAGGEENQGDGAAKSNDGSESNSEVKPVEVSAVVTEHQFQEWYRTCFIMNEEEEEDEGFTIDLPEDASTKDWISYVICYPISAMLYVFLPDVRRSYTKTLKWSVIEFCVSLIWIALFSLLLYEWLLVLCNSIGIPPKVAALTLLAGGTSVPDLLSSYVVAREGKGDMAVSSSIGSNIFDVTVGLPVPWIAYSVVNGGKSVAVVAKSLAESVMLLMIMLALVIGTVMAMKWEMNKSMGGLMMFFYLIFLVFSIAFSPILPE